jgi:lysophospholipase L1-like esterase
MPAVRRRGLALVALLAAAATTLAAGPAAAGERGGAEHRRPLAALGDSYSSGEGAPPFDPASDGCDRSPLAWPLQVAARLERPAALLACSGATTTDVLQPFKGQPAQVIQLAALRPRPRIVTITIGGNDVGFGPVLQACVAGDCQGAIAQSEVVTLTVLPGRLAETYRAIHRAAPGARLVVVGYPRLVPAKDSEVTGCPWLSTGERAALTRGGDLLDAVIAVEARRAHATFVDVRPAFAGHELCSAQPWLVPVGFPGVPPSSYAHPSPAGQAAIAARVTAVLGG